MCLKVDAATYEACGVDGKWRGPICRACIKPLVDSVFPWKFRTIRPGRAYTKPSLSVTDQMWIDRHFNQNTIAIKAEWGIGLRVATPESFVHITNIN